MSRKKRIGHVVLQHLSGPPAGDVEKPIIKGEVDVSDQGRHSFETLEQGRELFGISRLGGDLDNLADLPFAGFVVPKPDRGTQILQRNHYTNEPVGFPWIMSRPHLEDHLLLLAQIKRLHVTPLAQVPDVQVVSVSALKELFRHDAVFDLPRRAPLACQQRILS